VKGGDPLLYSTVLYLLYTIAFGSLIFCVVQILRLRRADFARKRPWLKLKLRNEVMREPGKKGSDVNRDGELIAYCRLYELTKSKRNIQLSIFTENVSHHFPNLKSDLLHFAQLLTTVGPDAYKWLESRFPPKHKFIRNVVAFLQTAESLPNPKDFLKQNSALLDKLSADHYKQRKDFQAPYLSAISSVPTMLVFLMVILMMLQYMNLIQSSIQYS
jgi:hypothetical protein